MRTIKFRAWSKDQQKMYDVDTITFGGASVILYGENSWIANVDDAPLMQFTDLLDKNGKEIYEGDIVSGQDCGGNPSVKEVKWERCAFRPLSIHTGCGDDEMRELEVIGNVYENPELQIPTHPPTP